MRKPKIWQRLTALALTAALVALDWWSKRLAENALKPDGEITLIPGVLGLIYTENTGVSFSLFSESRAAMTVVTVVTGLVLLALAAAMIGGKLEGMQLWSGALILAGGLGNWIDRAAQGYVIDYFEFLFVRFAIFNAADVYLTCGVFWLAALLLLGESRKRKSAVIP